jgi:hypothetical protein
MYILNFVYTEIISIIKKALLFTLGSHYVYLDAFEKY